MGKLFDNITKYDRYVKETSLKNITDHQTSTNALAPHHVYYSQHKSQEDLQEYQEVKQTAENIEDTITQGNTGLTPDYATIAIRP